MRKPVFTIPWPQGAAVPALYGTALRVPIRRIAQQRCRTAPVIIGAPANPDIPFNELDALPGQAPIEPEPVTTGQAHTARRVLRRFVKGNRPSCTGPRRPSCPLLGRTRKGVLSVQRAGLRTRRQPGRLGFAFRREDHRVARPDRPPAPPALTAPNCPLTPPRRSRGLLRSP